jgi:hypothetical protein
MQSSQVCVNEEEPTVIHALLVSALLAANLAIVGPRTLYAANSSEFAASYWSVLWLLAIVALGLTAALTLLQWLLPRRARSRALVFVFSLAVLAWLQGNWFLGNFGLLDGDQLDFSADATSRIRDALMWLSGIAAAQIFHRALRARVALIAGIFLVLQLVALPLDWGAGEGSDAEALSLVAEDEIFEFSTGTNIVLLILDTVTSDTFAQFVDREAESYDAAFSGFEFFSDTTGAFPFTKYSLPVMLGATAYDNRTPIDDYMSVALQRDAITGPLMEAGYKVDWVSAWPLFCIEGRYSNCYSIPRPYASPELLRLQMAAQLLDLSLFRHSPYGFKQAIYRDGRWLAQAVLWREGEAPEFVSSAAAFFDEYSDRIYIGRDSATLKILHAGGGHGPFVLDADCNVLPSGAYSRANYEEQIRCSMKQTRALLDRLRELDLYDRSLIVVAGDHGASFGARAIGTHGLSTARLSRSRPLLAVKWPGSSGGLRRSDAPASLEDIAPTIAAVAGIDVMLPGRDLATLARGEKRRRGYGLYVLRDGQAGGFLERVERYAVGPESRRPESWIFRETVFSPEIRLDAREITAGEPSSSGYFSYLGWGSPMQEADGTAFVPANGPIATIFAELPDGDPVELEARLRVRRWALPQTIEVLVDGVAVEELRIEHSEFSDYVIRLRGERARKRVTAIGFRAANSQSAESIGAVSAFDLARIRWRPLAP